METGEQFSLCWNNFHANLSTGFHSLLKDEDLVDVTLAAEGKFVKAHKTVLSVCSPFFKELFRVNPCKHPIVILPDVNFGALRSLLHFMYQGEVSVSQEEIPTFMKVAEILKVKGLTDNSDAPNGFPARNSLGLLDSHRQDILKRPRPIKKLIRPMQPLRPLETPNVSRSSHSPQSSILQPIYPKRQHLDSSGTPPPSLLQPSSSNQGHLVIPPLVSSSPTQSEALPLIKPKEEPLEHSEEETASQSGMDEGQMDLANMLDTQLSGGEPSPSHQIPPWPAPGEMTPILGNDESQPGAGLWIVKSGKGQLVLIHDGHMYTFVDQRENRGLWVCVKKKMLNCSGCLTTMHGQLLSYMGHNHPQIHDVIQRLQVPKTKSDIR
ncbi:modifier of mdg4 isoform X4 [Dendroctonus ponderosae]|uniref:BTB domain-containing protein n=1 Tax=Dendroctonus ponderosae TaxID=77166 RepID=A0AAR5Q3C2_DENPD|nr:modifier of mdg4 isoform X4 [Dendroctonus ponderosae]